MSDTSVGASSGSDNSESKIDSQEEQEKKAEEKKEREEAIQKALERLEKLSNENSESTSGTQGSDLINGSNGNDEVFGNESSDLILTGLGDDTVLGGAGEDVLVDEDGKNLILGNSGEDILMGSGILRGGKDDDILIGAEGEINILSGDLGKDQLIGADGEGTINLMFYDLEDSLVSGGKDGAINIVILEEGADPSILENIDEENGDIVLDRSKMSDEEILSELQEMGIDISDPNFKDRFDDSERFEKTTMEHIKEGTYGTEAQTNVTLAYMLEDQEERETTIVNNFDTDALNENTETLEANTEALEANTEALEDNTEALNANTDALEANTEALNTNTGAQNNVPDTSNSVENETTNVESEREPMQFRTFEEFIGGVRDLRAGSDQNYDNAMSGLANMNLSQLYDLLDQYANNPNALAEIQAEIANKQNGNDEVFGNESSDEANTEALNTNTGAQNNVPDTSNSVGLFSKISGIG